MGPCLDERTPSPVLRRAGTCAATVVLAGLGMVIVLGLAAGAAGAAEASPTQGSLLSTLADPLTAVDSKAPALEAAQMGTAVVAVAAVDQAVRSTVESTVEVVPAPQGAEVGALVSGVKPALVAASPVLGAPGETGRAPVPESSVVASLGETLDAARHIVISAGAPVLDAVTSAGAPVLDAVTSLSPIADPLTKLVPPTSAAAPTGPAAGNRAPAASRSAGLARVAESAPVAGPGHDGESVPGTEPVPTSAVIGATTATNRGRGHALAPAASRGFPESALPVAPPGLPGPAPPPAPTASLSSSSSGGAAGTMALAILVAAAFAARRSRGWALADSVAALRSRAERPLLSPG